MSVTAGFAALWWAVILLLIRMFGEPHRRRVVILLGSVVGVVLIGAGLFALAEDLPFTSALYWAVTTATTVGYGDITPHNPVGKLIASRNWAGETCGCPPFLTSRAVSFTAVMTYDCPWLTETRRAA